MLDVDKHYDHDPRNPDAPQPLARVTVRDEEPAPGVKLRTYNVRDDEDTARRIAVTLSPRCEAFTSTTPATGETLTTVVLAGSYSEWADDLLSGLDGVEWMRP